MDAQVAEYLAALVDRCGAVLGNELVGVYAAGSVAFAAYQRGRSDVDVAVVCETALPDPVKQRLVDRLRHESLQCPARGLELVVYRRDVAAAGIADPGFELELNTGETMPLRVTLRPEDRPEQDGLFWYGLDRSILHAAGLRLAGPAAAEVFADLDPAGLHELLVGSLQWWLSRTPSAEHPVPGADDAVLGACRALVRHRTGRWLDKVSAGRELVEQADEASPLIDRAIRARTGSSQPTGQQARAFQQRVLREISAGSP